MIIIQLTTQELNENFDKIKELLSNINGEVNEIITNKPQSSYEQKKVTNPQLQPDYQPSFEKDPKLKNKLELEQFIYNNKTDANIKNITAFYNFYLSKLDAWKGEMNVATLWQQWINRQKKI